MTKVKYTFPARSDMQEISNYIAKDNIAAAYKFLDQLEEKYQFLSQNPQAGRLREDIATSVRTFPIGRYVIYYRLLDSGIEIVRVLHAARKLKNLF